MSIYTIIFMAVLTVAAIADSAEPYSDRHDGAHTALRFAAAELQHRGGSFKVPSDGSFAQLAAKNPSLWLIGRRGDRSFSFGPVPETARRLFEQYSDVLDLGGLRVPNDEPALRVASFRRFDLGRESLLIAAGGVDP